MALLAAPPVLEPCGPFRRTPHRPVEGLGRTLVRSWLRAAGLWRASDNSPHFVEGKQGPEGVGRRAEQGVVMAAPTDGCLGVPGCCSRGGWGKDRRDCAQGWLPPAGPRPRPGSAWLHGVRHIQVDGAPSGWTWGCHPGSG